MSVPTRAHLSFWPALVVIAWGCRERAGERDLPETIYQSASYEFEAVPWGASDSAVLTAFQDGGLQYRETDSAGFRVFEPRRTATETRVLAWSDSAGLARVTIISAFPDSSESLQAFRDSLARLTARHGPPVRQTFGHLNGRLVAFGDWWDRSGSKLALTWRPDRVSRDSSRYLIIVDHLGPGWHHISPGPNR